MTAIGSGCAIGWCRGCGSAPLPQLAPQEAQQRFREDPQVVANRDLKKLREAAEGIREVLARHLPHPEQE